MDPLARHAQAVPTAPALRGGDRQWTYEALDRAVAHRAAALRARGMGPNARVAVLADRSMHTVALLWALWRMGAVAVPLSPREPTETIVQRAEGMDAQLLVTADDAVAAAASAALEGVAPDDLRGEGDRRSLPSSSLDRPATILYTSGSTGTPKAALHTWRNHLYNAKGANANLPLRKGDRWLLSLPLYHVGGIAILVRCAIAGAAVALPGGDRSVAAEVDARPLTHLSLVPTQFRRLLREGTERPPSALRAVLLGGGPIPDPLLRRGWDAGWPLHTSYGCTEMASQVTTTPRGASLDSLRTAGRRLPHRRIRIENGQILVGGAPLFRGYLTEDGLDDPRTEEGWYATGDRGHLTADGRLRVEGRVDRMFISGGENIQPEEIETALEAEAGVERAVVVDVPDAEYGRRPVAFVAGPHPGEEALRVALRDRLPGFKIPDAIYRLPEEATASSLKVDREQLRDRAHRQRAEQPNDNPDVP